jgi:phospholipase/carboxylesterase
MTATRPPLNNPLDPHAGQPVLTAGPEPQHAAATLILLHGRGAAAEDMRELLAELNVPGLAALAPQAAGRTWYPYSFLAPLAQNQPYLDSALRHIETLVAGLLARSVASRRIALLGFSQGACLATEFVARHPRPYGAVMGLTGGLIGPPGTPRDYSGSLVGVPVFLGAGDPDPHVPFGRVQETAATFERMGAAVELRRYPGLPHTISQDQLSVCRDMLLRLATATEDRP